MNAKREGFRFFKHEDLSQLLGHARIWLSFKFKRYAIYAHMFVVEVLAQGDCDGDHEKDAAVMIQVMAVANTKMGRSTDMYTRR